MPCAVQAKWDGVRSLSKNIFWSRKGKVYPSELVKHLEFKTKYILDGELVIEGETFQTISSYVKKKQEDQERLEYHVFDLVIENMPFSKRFEILQDLSSKFPENMKISDTFEAKNEIEIAEYHARFTEFFDPEGLERNKMGYFEGTMIRNLSGLYSINHRSADLLKLKDFIDEEYEIVGFYEGKGRNSGTITFICKHGEEEFHVNPMGTMEYRKKMWDERDLLLGKMLTVEFQEKTERGVPRFPIGKAIRDYE
jgi:DNA ligase-1